MLDLQDITLQYLSQKFQPELLDLVLKACTVLHRFNTTSYENDLVHLLSMEDDLDADDLRDQFTLRIYNEVMSVLNEHFITVDPDADPTFAEVIGVAEFLLLLQNMERNDHLAYRLHGAGTAKSILVDLMDSYTHLPRYRLMELFETVDDRLINAARELVKEKPEVSEIDPAHRLRWMDFAKFTQGTDSLAIRLQTQGFFGQTLAELVSLSRSNLQHYLQERAKVTPVETALDVVGLFYLCENTWKNASESFEVHSKDLLEDTVLISAVHKAFKAIHSDFTVWCEAQAKARNLGKDIAV